jgi:acyl-CoA synthetase (AMP-forming)/AMP-acid ligase II
MMTHRALMAEYVSCIVGLELEREDRVLGALPLYHSAQMHCLTMPNLMIGAFIYLIEAPVPVLCLELIEREQITAFFAPPTVWISLLQHPDFSRRDLSSLRKIQYGAHERAASLQPGPGTGIWRAAGSLNVQHQIAKGSAVKTAAQRTATAGICRRAHRTPVLCGAREPLRRSLKQS